MQEPVYVPYHCGRVFCYIKPFVVCPVWKLAQRFHSRSHSKVLIGGMR